MTGSEITAWNFGADNWERIYRAGSENFVAAWLAEPTHNGEVLVAYERLGPTVFRNWLCRGAAARAAELES